MKFLNDMKTELKDLIEDCKKNPKEAAINVICGILLIALALFIAICMFAM